MASVYPISFGLPFLVVPANTPGSFTNFALNQSTDQLEVIFQAADALTITRLGFRQSTVTGAQPVYRVSLQGVDGSGLPDGTIKSSSNAYADYTPSAGNNNTFQWVNLTSSYACSRGELLALVITYQSGTIGGSNFANFTVYNNINGAVSRPYGFLNDNGSRTNAASGLVIFGYGPGGKAYGNPLVNTSSLSLRANTTPDEVALCFTLPSGVGTSYRVAGIRAAMQSLTTTGHRVQLYSGTSVLQGVTPASGAISTGSGKWLEVYFDETSLTDLSYGSVYRVGIQPQSTVTSDAVYYAEVTTAADMDAWSGGQNWYYSTRTDDGAWSDTTTRRPLIELIIDDMTASGGGGTRGYGAVH